jgi:hypothetical protein
MLVPMQRMPTLALRRRMLMSEPRMPLWMQPAPTLALRRLNHRIRPPRLRADGS